MILEPCSSCGRDGVVFWKRVVSVAGRVGWRWKCRACKATRVLVVSE